MSRQSIRCQTCGCEVGETRSDLMGGAWDLAICAPCGRRRLVAAGGVALRLNETPDDAAFDLGEIFVRPGAVHILAQAGDHYWNYLQRHARGDAGDFRANKTATSHTDTTPSRESEPFLAAGGNVVSEYRTNLGHRLWIMTTPGKLTSVMAPGEF